MPSNEKRGKTIDWIMAGVRKLDGTPNLGGKVYCYAAGVPVSTVSNVQNGSPNFLVTTTAAHGLSTGASVTITGVTGTGNIPTVNDSWPKVTVQTTTTFTVDGSTYVSGAYSGGPGRVYPTLAVWQQRDKDPTKRWPGDIVTLDATTGRPVVVAGAITPVVGDGLYRFDVFDLATSPPSAPLYTINDAEYGGEFLVSVKSFGARGDGLTDDTARIQEGIDWCVKYAAATPRSTPVLWFPAGFYRTTKYLMVGRQVSGVWQYVSMELRGEHRSLTTNGDQGAVIVAESTTDPALCIQSAQGVSVVNLGFRGKNDTLSNFNGLEDAFDRRCQIPQGPGRRLDLP